VANPAGAFWGKDDFIYFGGDEGKKFTRINSSGGPKEVLLETSTYDSTYSFPKPLPDGRILLNAGAGYGIGILGR